MQLLFLLLPPLLDRSRDKLTMLLNNVQSHKKSSQNSQSSSSHRNHLLQQQQQQQSLSLLPLLRVFQKNLNQTRFLA